VLRLRRDIGSFRHSGDWLRQAHSEITGRSLVDPRIARTIKILTIVALIDLVYICLMACTHSAATQNEILAVASDNPAVQYFLFWLPSFGHLLSI